MVPTYNPKFKISWKEKNADEFFVNYMISKESFLIQDTINK